jgi:hypothetical protein
MTSRDIPTLLAILACVPAATVLTWRLSMKAIEYFLQGAEGEEVRRCLLVGVLRDAISALVDGSRSRLCGARN